MVKRVFLALLIISALFLSGCNIAALFSSNQDAGASTPETLTKNFVQTMQKKDFKKAQSFFSSTAQATYTPERLADSPLPQGTFSIVKSEQKKNGRITVEYQIVGKDKSESSQIAELVRENRSWKVSFFGPNDY